MVKEFGLIAATCLMSLLIVVKGDQQIVILLEGKLFKQGRDMAIAKAVYQKHKSALSLIIFVIGGAAMGSSVILLANGHGLFPIFASVTILLLSFGIWGRIRSFQAADRDLTTPENRSSANPTKAR